MKTYDDFPLKKHVTGRFYLKIKGTYHYFGPTSDPEGALTRYKKFLDSKIPANGKRAKRSDFPLWLHKATGQWCKKINGVRKYFGTDKDAALRTYKEGDKPSNGQVQAAPGELTLHELVCRFLSSQKTRVGLGELGQRTWDGYKEICDVLIAKFGKERAVSTLGPAEFEELLASYRKPRKLGLVAIGNFIIRTKVVFNYAKRNGLLSKDTIFGDVFRKPSKSAMRRERQSKPRKLFKAVEIRRLLKAASPQLRAMTLLGINCGFEPHDCAGLELRHLDLDGRWINYPRPKTTVDRRCPLWNATVKAIKVVLEDRPEPKNPEHAGRVFLTRLRQPWELQSAVSGEFAKLLRDLGLKEAALKDHRRLCFLALRHSFQTIGGKSRDAAAVSATMGHAPKTGDMAVEYDEERIEDARLRAVANFVWKWLRNNPSRRAEAAAVVHRS